MGGAVSGFCPGAGVGVGCERRPDCAAAEKFALKASAQTSEKPSEKLSEIKRKLAKTGLFIVRTPSARMNAAADTAYLLQTNLVNREGLRGKG